jgi:N-glycosidase YbiA
MERQLPHVPGDNRILFFRRDRDLFGFLSNFHVAPITIDGEVWRSTEFYYQAQKSDNPEYRDAIRNAKTAGHAKGLASAPARSRKTRKRSWFRDRIDQCRPDWNSVKLSIMEKAVRTKFGQHPDLLEMLLATCDAEIIEDSPYDQFWGIGRDGKGDNWMGRTLMKVREELRLISHGRAVLIT